ncbi:GAF domain-containing protein [Paracoccus sp. (in: a-proteobacteria)]|uniref:GAF domain-containing protein n=1 Tax=Paracoccus sp. TaxID=267 RepID=UPI00272B1E9B|nr:GAF domain-containing protein [Paracoccus sp. (in: a-proteobacteria)]
MTGFIPALPPANEAARLAAVRRSGLMDSENISRFDIYTRLFREIARTPIAYTGLIDEARQYFLSENFTGCMTGRREVAREDTICQYALRDTRPIIIDDLRVNPIYHRHALVTGDPWWVFWAGFPLVTPDGLVLGTLCAVDFEPRKLDEAQVDLMRGVAEAMAISIRLQTDQQDALADRTKAVLEDLKASGVTSVDAARDFLDLCLEHPVTRPDPQLMGTGLIQTGPEGVSLSSSGRSLKTGRGLGPSSFRVRTSPLRDKAVLDQMFEMLEG